MKSPLFFTEQTSLPGALPRRQDLEPASNLSALFDECHNYIYANEGLLKDKIFHEMVKLLAMKLHDEQGAPGETVAFGITAGEYGQVLAGEPGEFQARLLRLYQSVQSRYRSLLPDSGLRLKLLTLAFVAGRLQHVSLVDTPVDAKGEAFQAFVYRHQRGDRGEFFTPQPIVRLAVNVLAPQPDESVIDPACGSGGFIVEAIRQVQLAQPGLSRAAYVRDRVRGVEFNPDVALSAMLRLAFEGGTGEEITCANSLLEAEEMDGRFDVVLTNPPFGNKGKVEDRRVLQSYILARRWSHPVQDQKTYPALSPKPDRSQKTCQVVAVPARSAEGALGTEAWEPTSTVLPRQSPDILFIEKCVKLLKPGGRMAIVLPDGILQNVSNSHVRYWILSQARVLGVVSIPLEAFVPYGTAIKTSLLLLQKLPSDARRCFMAAIDKIGYNVKGQPVYKRDKAGELVRSASGNPIVDDDIEDIAAAYREFRSAGAIHSRHAYTVPDGELDSRLDVEHYRPDDVALIERLQAGGARPLGEIADIVTQADAFRQVGEADIRYIAIADVDARTMQVVNQQAIKAHEAPARATYRLSTGDIITAVSGASTGTPRQATALITEDEDGAICSNGLAVVRNVRGVDPLYLLAFMRTDYYLRQVRRLMTGHAIPAISLDDLSRVLVPIPSPEEQARIARSVASVQAMRKEALRSGDQAIDAASRLIAQSCSLSTVL